MYTNSSVLPPMGMPTVKRPGGGTHSNVHRSLRQSSSNFLRSPAGWLCWSVTLVLLTLTVSSVLHAVPLHMLNNRKRRALESARTLDRIHFDDFVSYVRMVDFCGATCYRTKAEAVRACWDKSRFCRVHFCRFEHSFGMICKPVPGAWLPSPSPKPSPPPPATATGSRIGQREPSMLDSARRPDTPCTYSKTTTRVGRSIVLRVKCSCDDGFAQLFNSSADIDVASCLQKKFSSMSTSLENACKARRNDTAQVYDWAFDTACSKCSGHRPRQTRCNPNPQ